MKMIETITLIVGVAAVLYYTGDHVYTNYIKKKSVQLLDEPTSVEEPTYVGPGKVNISVNEFNKLSHPVQKIVNNYIAAPHKAKDTEYHFQIGKAEIWRNGWFLNRPVKVKFTVNEQSAIRKVYEHFKLNYPEKTIKYQRQQKLNDL